MKPCIISCAVTGGAPTVDKHPAIPVTPAQIVEACLEAREAGAAIVHIHVRDPATGAGSMELEHYRDVVQGLKQAKTDVIVNLTTGVGGRFFPGEEDPAVGGPGSVFRTPYERMKHVLELRPEICSLDMGSLNFRDHIFINSVAHLREMAAAIRDAGVRPELEVFDTGHIALSRQMIKEGLIADPAIFQLCLGVQWGAPATPESLLGMRQGLPANALWSAFGIGAAEFPMVAQAAILGGNVRVGLEDNLFIERGKLAKGNGELVEKAARIVRDVGVEVATPAVARQLLGL